MGRKVSIITPCFNGEAFVSRYLDSILQQSYTNLELIFINDGSTDKTEQIVMYYKPKFEQLGINFIYIYQENAGQAAALNQGLKLFTGDYIIWPDSDDILSADSIEKRMRFLEEYKDIGLVRSKANRVNENNLQHVIGSYSSNKRDSDFIFRDLIEDKTYVCCGCYMIRVSAFLEVNPEREIYHLTRAGQNWQMLLPITYKFKCGYIDEPLYTYVIREDSHSHGITDPSDRLKHWSDLEDIMMKTFDVIVMSDMEKQQYIDLGKEVFVRKRFHLAIQLKDISMMEEHFKYLSSKHSVLIKERLIYFLAKNSLYHRLRRIKKILMNR